MARKILDYDPGPSPWDKEEQEEQAVMLKLQEEFIKRDEKSKKEQESKNKLTQVVTTKQETAQLEKEAADIKKLYVLDYWMRCFNRVSYYNEMAGQALFHVALGQCLNKKMIYLEDDSALDWRLHFLLIQDSSSGKGRAMNFVSRLFDHAEFKKTEPYLGKPIKRHFRTHKLGRMNAASLINTYAIDKNGRARKDMTGSEIVKIGILEQNDFISSEECRNLLEGGSDSLELQEILMTAMETIGSSNNVYTKQLTNYESPCSTKCSASFAITTRPFGRVKQTLVESGLIQRMLFLPKKLTFEEREKMNKASALAFKTANTKTPFSKDFAELVQELNKVVDFANENKIDFSEEHLDELLAFLHEKMMWFTYQVEETVPTEENRYILQSFVARYKENMTIMAFHSAAMRFSAKVEKQDLQYAFDYFKQLFEAQKVWVSLTVEENKDTKHENTAMMRTIERILKDDVNQMMTFPELVNLMAKKFGKDYEAMRYHIMKFSRGSMPLIVLEDTEDKRVKKVLLK